MSTVIKVENLAKQYRLGQVGTGTIKDDLSRFWAKIRGKEDPFSQIGEVNDRTQKGNSDFVWALQNINFDVQQGDVLGIIGRNGAGKSTLLKILSRTTLPTKGSLKIKGRIASLLEVGTGFHPELTGRENVFQNGAILGMTKKEIARKFDEIVDFSGVERYIDTPVKRYSSGMYVRLAFAVAAHLEPEILIVDEVLAVGDVEFQKKCLGKMKDVSVNEGRTVLFVSHNMAAVKNLCTKGLILEKGTITFSGNAESACNHYYSSNTSKFLTDINDRKDHVGNGIIVATNFEVINSSGIPTNSIISGTSSIIKLVLKKNVNEKISDVFIGVIIRTDNESIITFLATDELNKKLTIDSKETVVEFDIPKLLLRGGLYNISYTISIKQSNATDHLILDRLENVVQLEVEQGDFWNSGSLNRNGGYLQDFNIRVY